MGLAAHVARRVARGAKLDPDVEQAAMLGLVKAVDRFDPERGVPFPSFAGPVIEGEVKHLLRDTTWALKVPRAGKELHVAVRRANDELSTALGRSPTIDEVAAHLDVVRDDVVEGLAAGEARRTTPIDPGPDDQGVAAERVAPTGTGDEGFEDVENQALLGQLILRLPPRERELIRLRYFGELSQAQLAERFGISQMHVSRLLRRALELLRSEQVERSDLVQPPS